jgi:Glycosyltransferase family 92
VIIAILWLLKPQPSPQSQDIEEYSDSAGEEVEPIAPHEQATGDLIDETEVVSPENTDVGPTAPTTYHRNLTIATMMKNQRRWLREWIEFYRMMGAQHFLIYDNNSTDHPEEVLQHYIDIGLVTHVPWPPAEVPPPAALFLTELEAWQYSWFRDVLQTCLLDSWTVHRQVPCQLAAFSDAISRTTNGGSRWLGIFDVDEYIYPRPASTYRNLVELLNEEFADFDHVRIFGNTFGTSGHVEHAAQRKPGDAHQALLTESYVYRAPQDGIDI